MVKTKKFLCLFLAALMAFALFCGCTSSGKKDKDIQLSDYGLDEETVKEKYDFKSPAGNVYFRIVDELRVYEPGADIRYVVLADETLASETTVEVAFSNSAAEIDETVTHSFSGDESMAVVLSAVRIVVAVEVGDHFAQTGNGAVHRLFADPLKRGGKEFVARVFVFCEKCVRFVCQRNEELPFIFVRRARLNETLVRKRAYELPYVLARAAESVRQL